MARDYLQTEDMPRFSRPWWLQRLRNIVLVALVTILIWVYADLEFTSTVEMRATLRLYTSSPKRILFSDMNNILRRDVELSFELRGARGLLSTYEQDLQRKGSVISVDVTKTFGPGTHTLDVRDILNRTDEIIRGGLTVTSVSKPLVAIELDEAVAVENVEVVPQLTGAAWSDLAVEPEQITVWAPKRLYQQNQPAPRISTRAVDLSAKSGSASFTAEVAPFLGDIRVLPSRDDVKVGVQIGERTIIETLNVPVGVLIPPTWTQDETWAQYILQQKSPSSWVRRIEVQGPRRILEELKARPDRVRAYLVLQADDKKPIESWLPPREVEIRFPPEYQDRLTLIGEPPTVIFRMQPREQEAPATP